MTLAQSLAQSAITAHKDSKQRVNGHKNRAAILAMGSLTVALLCPLMLPAKFNPLARFVLFGIVPSLGISLATKEAKQYRDKLPEVEYAADYEKLFRQQVTNETQEIVKAQAEQRLEAIKNPPRLAPPSPPPSPWALMGMKIRAAFQEFNADIAVIGRESTDDGRIRYILRRGKDLKHTRLRNLMSNASLVNALIEAGLYKPQLKLLPGKLFIECLDPNEVDDENESESDRVEVPQASSASANDNHHSQNESTAQQSNSSVDVPSQSGVATSPASGSVDPVLAEKGNRLIQALAGFNIKATYIDSVQGARFIRHRIQPEVGVKYGQIKSLENDLQIALSLPSIPIISHEDCVYVDVPSERKILPFDYYLHPSLPKLDDKPGLKLAFGVSVTGGLVDFDLSDPESVHWLVGGATGGGKTELAIALLFSGMRRYSPSRFQYVISTIKPEDFCEPLFQSNPWAWQGKKPVKQAQEIIGLLDELVAEMNRRRDILANNGCKNIDVYNAKFPHAQMPHLVYWLDEWTGTREELEAIDAKTKEMGDTKSEPLVSQLERNTLLTASGARSAGIHLCIGDQKPSEKTLPTMIRSNLKGRCCLKVQEPQDSKIILGVERAGGESLLGKGDMIILVNGQSHRLQGLLVDTDSLSQSYPESTPPSTPYDSFDAIYEDEYGVDPDKEIQQQSEDSDLWSASGLDPAIIEAIKRIQK